MSATGLTSDWATLDRHPDAGTRFATTVVPGFHAAVALCTELHGRLPHVGVVGWDVMIEASSCPHVVEWNAYTPVITYAEPVSGPCFEGLGWESLWMSGR